MELKKRNEVDIQYTWNVSDLYENEEAWQKDIDLILEMSEEIATYEGKLTSDPKTLLKGLDLYTKLLEKIEFALNYTQRLHDVDTKVSKYQMMNSKMNNLYATISNITAFISPELIALENLEDYVKEEERLSFYVPFIKEMTRMKEHTLTKEMEKLIALTEEMSATPANTFNMLNDADMSFGYIKDENGNDIQVTHGNFVLLEESKNREVRKAAYETLYNKYKEFANTLATIYDGQVKQLIFHAKARNYKNTLEASVDQNNVPSSVYYNLMDTITKNMHHLHRYVNLRKKLLNLDELHMYDIYTPIIEGIDKRIPYQEATQIVLEALAPLGEDYVSKVKEGFENRWIDVYENEGKTSGAYSAGAYGAHPYVLLNYVENMGDMFTIAHEMGHAMHSYYSNEAQPFIYANYKIFVAEVASTVNENLLMAYLLKHTTDKKETAFLLNHYLEGFKGTIYRQAMLAEYEMLTNQMAENGESLNAENLCKVYKSLNEKYYGISDDYIAYEWAKIPHFYYNFYMYQYATGYSCAVAIANAILKEGAPAVERYKKFLSSGCSDAPVELLKIAGIDLSDPKPVEDALNVMGAILDQLEELLQ